MNALTINNKEYKLEFFNVNKSDRIWPIKDNFVKVLNRVNKMIGVKKHLYLSSSKETDYEKIISDAINDINPDIGIYIKKNKSSKCPICGKNDIQKGFYVHGDNIWESGGVHYIENHGFIPSKSFVEFIYLKGVNIKSSKNNRLIGTFNLPNGDHNGSFVKLSSNQLLIIDALMENGGRTKKYIDDKGLKYRYSEHSGVLDFNGNYLDRIIVSGNTTRTDDEDDTIFLPENMKGEKNYKYMFHTHPPTPKPGGRMKDGILYEFPSVDDIDNYVEKSINGNVIGSIILAPEGLYNIRHSDHTKRIRSTRNTISKDAEYILDNVQEKAIKKYETKTVSKDFFHRVVSNNKRYINSINEYLHKHNLHIDYFPRMKSRSDKWVMGDIYLPIH